MASFVDPCEPIDIDLPGFGPMAIPMALADWLDTRALIPDFGAELARRAAAGVHGDAFTPYAQAHHAPPAVLDAIAGYGAYMDERYG